jgi:GTPase Era involved in 16S rRNA processing
MSLPAFAVVGHPNKGKSSIVSTLASDDSVSISPEPGTTTHRRRFPMTVDGEELYALVDTPGFQRARRALDWMRRHETTADRHVEVVHRFVEVHRGGDVFAGECELLQPIIDGAGILYVVDGSVPFGEEYEPEMEILRWTGQPSMALINPIGAADYIEPWKAALGQYFKVVRVFDAVMAEFDKRIELLRAFGQLREEWRQSLERAVQCLQQDRERQRRLAARAIAGGLACMLGLQLEEKLTSGDELDAVRSGIQARLQDGLRSLEQRCRDEVETVYSHRRIERREAALTLLDEDLFAEKTWLVFGLRKSELMATGALGGAATGAVVDAQLGGMSFLLGAVVGAGIGAALGWWTADRLVRVRVLEVPLGGKKLVAGPTRNRSFPHVVFNRARYHHFLVARRNHSLRGELALTEHPDEVLPPLSKGHRSELERRFERLRRDSEGSDTLEGLVDTIAAIFSADEKQAPFLEVTPPGGAER